MRRAGVKSAGAGILAVGLACLAAWLLLVAPAPASAAKGATPPAASEISGLLQGLLATEKEEKAAAPGSVFAELGVLEQRVWVKLTDRKGGCAKSLALVLQVVKKKGKRAVVIADAKAALPGLKKCPAVGGIKLPKKKPEKKPKKKKKPVKPKEEKKGIERVPVVPPPPPAPTIKPLAVVTEADQEQEAMEGTFESPPAEGTSQTTLSAAGAYTSAPDECRGEVCLLELEIPGEESDQVSIEAHNKRFPGDFCSFTENRSFSHTLIPAGIKLQYSDAKLTAATLYTEPPKAGFGRYDLEHCWAWGVVFPRFEQELPLDVGQVEAGLPFDLSFTWQGERVALPLPGQLSYDWSQQLQFKVVPAAGFSTPVESYEREPSWIYEDIGDEEIWERANGEVGREVEEGLLGGEGEIEGEGGEVGEGGEEG
jgi:hypothetical protein